MKQMAVWIDHAQAHVLHVDGDASTTHADNHHVHRHPKDADTKTRNHPQDEARFFDEVTRLLVNAEEILLLGPSVTKLHFLKYAQKHTPAVASRVIGIETADHPTDRELRAHVLHYFHADPPRIGVAS
jgi:hypothetical protein